MEDIFLERKKLVIIYSLMIVSIILNMFVIPKFLSIYWNVLNLVIWLVIFVISRKVSNQHNRFKGKSEKLKSIFIIVLIYLMLYYLSGLFFGYKGSVYSHSLYGLAYNFTFYILVVMLQEYTRSRLVNNTRSKVVYSIITVLMILLSYNYATVYNNFSSGENIFKFIASDIYPAIIKGILCCFLVKLGSYELSLMFLMPIKIMEFITPIVPDLDWFLIVSFDSALVLLLYYYTYYEHMINVERFTRKQIEYANPKKTACAIIFVLAFTFFVAGFFPAQPVAIMSNSMYPEIKRGDVVIVEKIDANDINKLKVGDIIEYTVENKSVVHRIDAIVNSSGGKFEFVTKGDNNRSRDPESVSESQIKGKVNIKVPYIGYPSVIFSEKVLNMEAQFLYEGE